MIAVRCQYCGARFSIDEWQSNNFCCSQCNVTRFERRQCPHCRVIYVVARGAKDEYCPACLETAIEGGLVKRARQLEKPKGTKACIVCGTPFPFVRKNALYCNEHCRKLLENQRRKERYATFLREICQTKNLKP